MTIHLSVRRVSELCGVSIATIWRWSSSGLFPAPVKLGPNTTRWRTNDIEAWLDKTGRTA